MNIQLRKITATEAVVESLKERIRSYEFGPGEKLPSEQALLKEYDVSRLTLREALAKLAAWGVILVRHGKGAFVSESISIPALNNALIPMFPNQNSDRMTDLVEARNMIESEIAGKVAKKRNDADIQELQTLLIYDTRKITSAEKFAERDYAFHMALASIAGNVFLFSMYQALYTQIRSFLVQYAKSVMDWEKALDRHTPILKAIIDRDRGKARFLAREHAGICASYIHKYKDQAD
ncbi:MAG: FadR family transcriptional regulator [Desulfobacteraceae bacterium]|nr:FadR family transcriptional regulator [Desulfobacteraceae bacterium]